MTVEEAKGYLLPQTEGKMIYEDVFIENDDVSKSMGKKKIVLDCVDEKKGYIASSMIMKKDDGKWYYP